MTKLDPMARALIHAAKGGDAPTPAQLDEVLGGFRQRAAMQDAASSPDRTSVLRLRSSARVGSRRLVAWSLAAVVLTGSVAAFADWSTVVQTVIEAIRGAKRARSAPAEPTAVRRPLRGKVTAAPKPKDAPEFVQEAPEAELAVAETSTGPVQQAAPSVAKRAATKAQPHAAAAPPAPADPTALLTPELRLIVAARDALKRSDFAGARALASEHAREFPNGELALERQTILAFADCQENGDTLRAQQFIARYPRSLFASRLARECGLSISVPATERGDTHLPSAPDAPGAERTP